MYISERSLDMKILLSQTFPFATKSILLKGKNRKAFLSNEFMFMWNLFYVVPTSLPTESI